MRRNVRIRLVVTMFFVIVNLSFLIIASSATLPRFFVGMHAEYEFNGDITLNGQTVYKHASIINWTVLDLEKNTAKIDTEMTITHEEGFIPESVSGTFNPFPNASWRKTLELNLNQSYWLAYLNDTANDLLSYKVGEKAIESEVGMIQCYLLQLRRPRQEWDAFYDKNSGILISLQETFWVGDYSVSYNKRIIDTNAHLSVAAAEALDHATLFILAAVVVILISIGFLVLKRRRKSNLKPQTH